MVLSQTAVYALRAALHLAEQEASDRLRVDDIAEELGVPRNYLSKILHALARDGVLSSSRGPGGGFELARPADEVTLEEIVQRFDGFPSGSSCLLGRPQCSEDDPCAAHERWKEASHALRAFFHETTLADLARTEQGAVT
jgi:Rrf2 family iron-sulfur cluster assembly transcriptional regulator